MLRSWAVFFLLFGFVKVIEGACTFPSEIDGVWYSAHKGALTFNSTHLTGYPIYMSASVGSLDFECYEKSDRKYLIRATETVFVFGQYIRAYICIQLWRVSSTKYYYYMGTTESATNADHVFGRVDAVYVDTTVGCNENEPYNTGSFIMLVKDAVSATNNDNVYGTLDGAALTFSDGCNAVEPYAATEFIILVKEGEVATGNAEATCAQPLLAKWSSVSISDSTGSTTCTGSTMDACTDPTEMTYTYDASCGSTLKFSSGGNWVCLHSITSGDYTYMAAWNNDSSVDGITTYQITCYVISSSASASEYPGYCKDSSQTPTSVPSPGILYTFSGATETCYLSVEGGSSVVYYLMIILGSCFIIASIVLIVCLKKKGAFAACRDKCRSKDRPTSSTESTIEQGEHVNNTVFKIGKLKPILGMKTKRPLRIGPIVEPSLEPLPKVEPLYAFVQPQKKRTPSAVSRQSIGSIFKFDASRKA